MTRKDPRDNSTLHHWQLLKTTGSTNITAASSSLLDYEIPTEQTFDGNLVKNVLDEHWGREFIIEQLLTAIERQLGAVLVLSLISTESKPFIHLWLLQWPLTTSTTRATGLHDMDGSQCTTDSTPTLRHVNATSWTSSAEQLDLNHYCTAFVLGLEYFKQSTPNNKLTTRIADNESDFQLGW